MADADNTTAVEEMENTAAVYLASIAGLFRAIAKLVGDDMGNEEVFAVADAGTHLAEKGLSHLERVLREHRTAQSAAPAV